MSTLYTLLLFVVLITVLAIVLVLIIRFVPLHKKPSSPDTGSIHTMKMAVRMMHYEAQAYHNALEDAISLIHEQSLDQVKFGELTFEDVKNSESELRLRYLPGQFAGGLSGALLEFKKDKVKNRANLQMAISAEEPLGLTHEKLAYLHGLLVIISDNMICLGGAAYCDITVGVNDKKVYALISSDSKLDLADHLNHTREDFDGPEVMAYLYKELLGAKWQWHRKEKELNFELIIST